MALWSVLIDKDKLEKLSSADVEKIKSIITNEIMTNPDLQRTLKPRIDNLVDSLIAGGGGKAAP